MFSVFCPFVQVDCRYICIVQRKVVDKLRELEVGKQYRQALIDAETGELMLMTEFTHEKQLFLEKTVYYRKNEADPRTFLNVRISAFPELATKLSCPLLGHAVMLATFMKYNAMLYRYENSSYPMTREELAEVMQVSQRTLSRTLNQLKNFNILTEVTVSKGGKRIQAFKMNSAYFFRGSRPIAGRVGVTAKLFTDTMRQLYQQNGAAKTGFFCKLLPYLDKETNIICANPRRDTGTEHAKPLGVSDIAEMTGVSVSNVSDYLRSIKYGNKFAFAKLSAGAGSGRKLLFIMSPELASRTQGLPTVEIMKYFEVLNAA